MTNIVITPTLYEEKRLEAISYFKRDILVIVLSLRLYYSVK